MQGMQLHVFYQPGQSRKHQGSPVQCISEHRRFCFTDSVEMVNLQSCKNGVRNGGGPFTLTLDPGLIQRDNESVCGYGADLVGGSGNIKMPGKFLYPKEALFPQAAPPGKRDLGMAQCRFEAVRPFPAQGIHHLSVIQGSLNEAEYKAPSL